MQWLPYIVAYAGIAIFAIAVVARFFLWAKMPMHLRWELYPVAHEASKASYGGSYLEETEWWNKKREVSLLGELKVMVPEILFLVALKEHNPKLWIRSLPFHFGLYVIAVCTVLLLFTGILGGIAPSVVSGGFGTFLGKLILVTGVVGPVLGIIGAIGLLQRRMSEPSLRDYSSGADFFNLVFFVIAFGCALLNFVVLDRDFTGTMAFAHNLVTFDFGQMGFLPGLTVVLLSALVAYIPLTHMSHFVGKYFAYHSIRWNDTPNLKGGPEEGTIGSLLSRPVSWSAPHIQGDGKKTWADVATEEVEK